jgi:hypothetical protein
MMMIDYKGSAVCFKDAFFRYSERAVLTRFACFFDVEQQAIQSDREKVVRSKNERTCTTPGPAIQSEIQPRQKITVWSEDRAPRQEWRWSGAGRLHQSPRPSGWPRPPAQTGSFAARYGLSGSAPGAARGGAGGSGVLLSGWLADKRALPAGQKWRSVPGSGRAERLLSH